MIHAEQNVDVVNSNGRLIHTTVTLPSHCTSPSQLVILCHGFKGFRNWGFFPYAAQHLADSGFCVVRADTSMNGMNGSNDRVLDVEAFAHNTPSREIDDLHELMASFATHEDFIALRNSWDGTVHAVGHSRGAGAVHVFGRERTEQGQLGRYVMWNAIGHWERWTPRQREHWLAAGTIDVENSRTGQTLQLDTSLLHDIEQQADRLSLAKAASVISDRTLYVHATGDLTVPLKEIQQLRSSSASAGPLITINGSTHSFGITHPVDHITRSFVDVLEHTVTFLQQ